MRDVLTWCAWKQNNPLSRHLLSTVTHRSPHFKMICYFAVESWMQFSPLPHKTVSGWCYGCLHASSHILLCFPKCTADLSNSSCIFSSPMPHLNKSVIRWIAVRWLPNKATQIRVNIDSGEWAHDSLGRHHVCHADNIARPPITVLAGWCHREESKSWRERESSPARLILSRSCWMLVGSSDWHWCRVCWWAESTLLYW